jgi:hypothetical protein
MTEPDARIAWLNAQIDEDERIALAATIGPWVANIDKYGDATIDGPEVLQDGGQPYGSTERIQVMRPLVVVPPDVDYGASVAAADALHIVRFDPKRMLAEVAAKRQIMNAYRLALYHHGVGVANIEVLLLGSYPRWTAVADARLAAATLHGQVVALESVVAAIAQPYAGRPGFPEEWRP